MAEKSVLIIATSNALLGEVQGVKTGAWYGHQAP
jgi:hypothetical protein